MLHVELATQLRRPRSLVLYGVLAALPILAAATQKRGGAATFSALNFAESGLNFMDPVLFGLVAAVFGSILGGADREWGTLRYLYVRPVSVRRLLTGKWSALAVCCALAIITFLLAAELAGAAEFGWHPFHRSTDPDLSWPEAIWATLGAGGYLIVCLLSIGSIALALGLLLPRSVEALAISVAFLIASVTLDNVQMLHPVIAILPVHYWMRWTHLFDGGGGGLLVGLAVQVATIAIALAVAHALAGRRDPAA